jgi:hypothetical protein
LKNAEAEMKNLTSFQTSGTLKKTGRITPQSHFRATFGWLFAFRDKIKTGGKNMGILYVSLAAFGGGIVSALLGWLQSGENFVSRKFASSVLRALVAGGVFAISYTALAASVDIMNIVIAFVAGAGVDVLGNRAAGSITGSPK